MAFQPDPYNGFTNDSDRRLALKVKEIRLGVVGVAFCFVAVLVGPYISPEVLPWLMKVLYRFSVHG